MSLLWYRTNQTRCVAETIINRREWDNAPWIDYPVGELPQYGPYRDFTRNGGVRPGLLGNHVCNAEWFTTGEPWPTDLPEQKYDADDIPVCCGRAVGRIMGEGDPTGPGAVVYGPAQHVMGEGSPMGRAQYIAHPAALASGSGSPAALVAVRIGTTALASGQGEPVAPLYYDAYQVSCGGDVTTVLKIGGPADLVWQAVSPSSGRTWRLQKNSGNAAWRTLRTKDGLPSFFTWTSGGPWGALATAPTFNYTPPPLSGQPCSALVPGPNGSLVFTH